MPIIGKIPMKMQQTQKSEKRTNALVLEAQQLINKLRQGGSSQDKHNDLRKKVLAKKRTLKGGAIGTEDTSVP